MVQAIGLQAKVKYECSLYLSCWIWSFTLKGWEDAQRAKWEVIWVHSHLEERAESFSYGSILGSANVISMEDQVLGDKEWKRTKTVCSQNSVEIKDVLNYKFKNKINSTKILEKISWI